MNSRNCMWNSLLDESLKTQNAYSKEDFQWLKINIYEVYSKDDINFNINTKYVSIILLNRSIKLSKYALIFNQCLCEAIQTKNRKSLIKILKNPPLEEFNSLPENEKSKWLLELDNHIIAHNLYMDRKNLSNSQLYGCELKNTYSKCLEEVCKNSELIEANPDIFILTFNFKYKTHYLINELDLVYFLCVGENDFSIDDEIPESIIDELNNKYKTEILIFKKALELGYIHSLQPN